MKIAFVHDWLNQYGGAEQVLAALHEIYPLAPIYTSIYRPEAMPQSWQEWDIRATFMDRLPEIHRRHQPYLPLYPLAFSRLDLSDYDLVISNKSGFCHGVKTGPRTLHICYCLTPTRYIWNYADYVREERIGRVARAMLPLFISLLKGWDYAAAQRVGEFLAISKTVQQRIKRFYNRDSVIIYPPVDVERFSLDTNEPEDYFLILSRLVPYKRIDLAIAAFNRTKRPLLVIGEGRDRARLEKMAGPTVQFLGNLPNGQVAHYLSRARALIFPGEEDFGLAPLEAQAAGRPVIAYAGGGARETVIEGETGVLFTEPNQRSLIEALQRFQGMSFDPAALRANAQRFSKQVFQNRLQSFVQEKWQEWQSKGG
ncbi:MAG: glycosyltransferase [Chloroflexi bacterium]|nr:glycosyltransferase [Chloroflexota bacterium]